MDSYILSELVLTLFYSFFSTFRILSFWIGLYFLSVRDEVCTAL